MKSQQSSEPEQDSTDIDWAEQNKMLADLRWKQRGQPIKNEWWSI